MKNKYLILKKKYLKLKYFYWTSSELLKTTIARRNKIRVIINILIMQIKKNFSKKPFVFKTCTNTFAYTQKNIDTSGVAGLFYCGLMEANEILCAWHLIRPNDIFFDIGANQGAWGLILCAKKIYCHEFEPSSVTFQSLKKQISLNNDFNDFLLPHKLAVSNKNGTIQFTVGRGQNNQIKSDFSVNTLKSSHESVKVATLDSLAEKYGYPTIIKIDTEGFTNEVLEKGIKVLNHKSLKALFIETFRKNVSTTERFKEMEKLLANYGFFPYFFDISKRILTPITKLNEGGQDTIYIRHNKENLSLIKESKPLKIFNQYY